MFEHHSTNDYPSDQTKEYKANQQNKRETHWKKDDKAKAKQNNEVYIAIFNLHAVLTTHCSLVSEMNYAQKLSS